MQYLQGGPAGPIAYYVDVKALLAGWSIYLRRGPTIQSPPVLHLTKGVCLIWDKGTQVKVEVSLRSSCGHMQANNECLLFDHHLWEIDTGLLIFNVGHLPA